ncbi:MAG TPA: sulfatase-like hydrolase/transferase [Opitutus sp.]|nr:sulfatase-like hydrolase/transferase [Opitutus sp.]
MATAPDILWIVTTQWRAQACGFAGDPNARTPHLDALAAQSVNFTQAVTPHPFGPFARAALLTGVPSPANGVRDYFDPLPAAARTVAHALGARGYATAFFGKWHLARRDPAAALVGEGHARMIVPAESRGGFSFWEGFESGFLLNDPWLHGTRLPEPQRFEGYQSDVVCGRAAEWMAAAGAGARPGDGSAPPYFCVVSVEPPHPPYDAPAAGVTRREAAAIELPANVPRGGEIEARARRELAGYHAHLEATDRAVGRLVAAVDAAAAHSGRQAPIMVFTSVHGDMHGAHGLLRKGWPHEESVRVPLLVRAGTAAPASTPELVSLLDLPRWTIAWADAMEPDPAPAAQRISMPSVVALPHQCDRTWQGVRTSARKLVLNADGSPWLLFDLANDPLELNNLADDPRWRDEIARLRERIQPAAG